MEKKYIKFWLDGCDISFIAKAPKDMTLEQFIKQASRIKPGYCACGISSRDSNAPIEIEFDYNDVRKIERKDEWGICSPDCTIRDENEIQLMYCD